MLLSAGDSAIVVKDLPLEDGGKQDADDRLAAFDAEMGRLEQNAKLEELSRGSGAEPDLLVDDEAKQALLENEAAAGGGQVQEQEADEGAEEQIDLSWEEPEQGTLEDDYEQIDAAKRALLQAAGKRNKEKGKGKRNPDEQPGAVSRSLPAEVLPAEEDEFGGASMTGQEEDREIVMTDVSAAEAEAEQRGAVSDPGESDNWEEGLLSAREMESSTEVTGQGWDGRGRGGAGTGGTRRTGSRRRKTRDRRPRRATGRKAGRNRREEVTGAAHSAGAAAAERVSTGVNKRARKVGTKVGRRASKKQPQRRSSMA